MKKVRSLFLAIIMVAALLTSALSVNAIGFDAEEAYESVFVVYSGNSMGSGFAVGENCIITNAHVIESQRNIVIEDYFGTQYNATLLGIDEYKDLAVLAVKDVSFPYLEIADLSTMKTGDDIYAIGAPMGMTYTLTKGGISSKERLIENQTYIQLDAPINEGNSGGPLLNDDGQVLGINTLKMLDSEGIGLAIPADRICEMLTSMDIELNDNGNVVGAIEVPDDGRPAIIEPEENTGSFKLLPENSLFLLLSLGFVASMTGNVLLLILLISEKKKKARRNPNDIR